MLTKEPLSLAKSKGFSFIELVVVITILSVFLNVLSTQYFEKEVPMSQAERASEDISEIKKSATSYYLENNSWPLTLDALEATGHLVVEVGLSPFGTNYVLGNNGEYLTITVKTNRMKLASLLKGKVLFGSIANDNVTVTTQMGPPTQVAIQSAFLARKAIAGCDDCNKLETGTNLDINGNDIKNIENLDAQEAVIDTAKITQADITALQAELISLGVNSLTYSGNQLNINTGTLAVNGAMSVGGNINANNNNLTGVNRISAISGAFTTVNGDNYEGNTFNGSNFTTSKSSVNGNKSLIDDYIAKWQACQAAGGCK